MKVMPPDSSRPTPPSSLPPPQLGPEPGQTWTPAPPQQVVQPQVAQPQPQVQPPVFGAPQPPRPSIQPAPDGDYDFIMNAGQAPKTSWPGRTAATGGSSKLMRVLVVMGILTILLVGFIIIRGLLSGGSNHTQMLSVVQHQQKLIHLTTNALTVANLSTAHRNFAATTQVSLTSSQTDLLGYLALNGLGKVGPKVLDQKISAKTDTDLTAAVAADTFNPTFHEVMKQGLTEYRVSLEQAFDKTTGEKGRELLTNQYRESELLVEQLNAAVH